MFCHNPPPPLRSVQPAESPPDVVSAAEYDDFRAECDKSASKRAFSASHLAQLKRAKTVADTERRVHANISYPESSQSSQSGQSQSQSQSQHHHSHHHTVQQAQAAPNVAPRGDRERDGRIHFYGARGHGRRPRIARPLTLASNHAANMNANNPGGMLDAAQPQPQPQLQLQQQQAAPPMHAQLTHQNASGAQNGSNGASGNLDGSKIVFERVAVPPVDANRPARVSQLTSHLQGDVINLTGRLFPITVFLAFLNGQKFRVKIPETATVEQSIRLTLAAVRSSGGMQALPSNDVHYYVLRIADDDGCADEDLPALDYARLVQKVGFDMFTLCISENVNMRRASVANIDGAGVNRNTQQTLVTAPRSARPAADAAASEPSVRAANFSSGTAGVPNGTSNGHGGNAGSTKRNPADALEASAELLARPIYKRLEDVLVQVSILPDRLRNVYVSPDLMLKDLRDVLVTKLGLENDGHRYLLKVTDPISGQSIEPTGPKLEVTMGVLSTRSVVLEGTSLSSGAPAGVSRHSFVGSQPGAAIPEDTPFDMDFFFSEFTASQYSEYRVVKVNKYGQHQERRLGIDRDNLYNMVPKGQEAKQSKTKHPLRPVVDIMDAYLEEPPSEFSFSILFRDPKSASGREVLNYIVTSKRTAMEIVSKIKYLLKLRHK
eukprot:ANDGO_08306.mRNA.1 Ras-interacting protein RIP3